MQVSGPRKDDEAPVLGWDRTRSEKAAAELAGVRGGRR